MRVFRILAAMVVPALLAAAPAPRPKAAFKVTWLGHAAFEVVSPGGTDLLIDPYLTQDPATPAADKDLSRYRPAAILVTHSHFDHVGDTTALAKRTGAKVIAPSELMPMLGVPPGQFIGCNVGGRIQVGDVTIHVVPAMHSSTPGGRPVGYVLTFKDGRSLYHTGDTWIFGDMALIQELYHPSVLLLCVGGGPYTEDPATAALAVKKYFHPEAIVPMHYGTFPGLAKAEEVRRAFAGDKRLRMMRPGETLAF